MAKKKKPARKRVSSPFAKNLKAILEERALNQKRAATIADVAPATIADWLSGSMPNDPLAVQRLCKGLNCSFEWLLTGANTTVNKSSISLSELFDSEDEPSFSGIFEISAKRLKRKGSKDE